MTTKRLNRRQQAVLEALRAWSGAWVSGLDLASPWVGGNRYSARIHELRQMGYQIEKKPSRVSTYLYRLVNEQMTLEDVS